MFEQQRQHELHPERHELPQPEELPQSHELPKAHDWQPLLQLAQ
jgi:hypothetical protein